MDIFLLIIIGLLGLGVAFVSYENHATRKENEELAEQLDDYEHLTLRFWMAQHPMFIVSLKDLRIFHKNRKIRAGEQYSLLRDGDYGGELDLTLEYHLWTPTTKLVDPRLNLPPETNTHGTEIR